MGIHNLLIISFQFIFLYFYYSYCIHLLRDHSGMGVFSLMPSHDFKFFCVILQSVCLHVCLFVCTCFFVRICAFERMIYPKFPKVFWTPSSIPQNFQTHKIKLLVKFQTTTSFNLSTFTGCISKPKLLRQ